MHQQPMQEQPELLVSTEEVKTSGGGVMEPSTVRHSSRMRRVPVHIKDYIQLALGSDVYMFIPRRILVGVYAVFICR